MLNAALSSIHRKISAKGLWVTLICSLEMVGIPGVLDVSLKFFNQATLFINHTLKGDRQMILWLLRKNLIDNCCLFWEISKDCELTTWLQPAWSHSHHSLLAKMVYFQYGLHFEKCPNFCIVVTIIVTRVSLAAYFGSEKQQNYKCSWWRKRNITPVNSEIFQNTAVFKEKKTQTHKYFPSVTIA